MSGGVHARRVFFPPSFSGKRENWENSTGSEIVATDRFLSSLGKNTSVRTSSRDIAGTRNGTRVVAKITTVVEADVKSSIQEMDQVERFAFGGNT